MHLDRDTLRKFFTFEGARPNAAWIEALSRVAPELAGHYQMSVRSLRHLFAQIGAETSGLSLAHCRENMRFTTPERVLAVYGYRIGLAQKNDPRFAGWSRQQIATWLCGKPDALADVAYGGREGTPAGMGHMYIGRGPTQITHRNNYVAIRNEIMRQPDGITVADLERWPQTLEEPEWGVRSAFADFAIKRLARWADADDVDNVSSTLNTGAPYKTSSVNNLAGRRRWARRAKEFWPDSAPAAVAADEAPPPQLFPAQIADCQRRLTSLGYHCGNPDGEIGSATRQQIYSFQDRNGLPVTGLLDGGTVSLLMSDQAQRQQVAPSRQDITADELARRGSRTISLTRRMKTLARRVGGALGIYAADSAGPGVIDRALGAIDKVTEVSSRVGSHLLSPRFLVIAVVLAVLSLVWVWANRIEENRVEDARTGANKGK